jgi:hypothetical protein
VECDTNKADEFVHRFGQYMKGRQGLPQIVFILMDRKDQFYSEVKQKLQLKFGVPTQCALAGFVRKKTATNIAANLLKQMNAKLNGDLYHVKFQNNFGAYKRPMVCGLDVSHEGPESVVGFTATTDKNCCKYYHNAFYQPRKVEVINRNIGTVEEVKGDEESKGQGRRMVSGALQFGKMEQVFVGALENYKKINKDYPDLIMLYRDGVGSMIS